VLRLTANKIVVICWFSPRPVVIFAGDRTHLVPSRILPSKVVYFTSFGTRQVPVSRRKLGWVEHGGRLLCPA